MPTGYNTSLPTQMAMIANYRAGKTCAEAAAPFSLCAGACKLALRRNGVAARSRVESQRVFKVDHRFFQHVDCEEKAYWLGFFTADGCVYNDRIQLTLSTKDRGHLERWRNALGSDVTIREVFNETKSVWTVSTAFKSKEMADDLAALGVHPRKTYSAYPWAAPQHLARHYWRGAVDGDGGLSAARASSFVERER